MKTEDKKRFYKDWSWDSSDLLQCKQACTSMLVAGVSTEELLTLDFGQLWVEAVIEDFENSSN